MTEKNGDLKCEGGKLECSGHRVQACVIDKDRDDVVKYLGNIAVRSLVLLLLWMSRRSSTDRWSAAHSASKAMNPARWATGSPR